MRPITFAIPGDIDTPTGGYRYDRALLQALGDKGHAVEHLVLGAGFPDPSEREEQAARADLAAVPSGHALMIDGLAFGVLPRLVAAAPVVALVHHPLALETGVTPDDARRLMESETAALEQAVAIVVTSAHTKDILVERFAVPRDKVTVALPGLETLWRAIENRPTDPPLIVAVGSLTARKGHDVLIAALGRIREIDWRCEIIGSGARDGEVAQALAAQIEASGLAGRVALRGALSETDIAARYAQATVFALATRYEGFGMVFAEAMAAGLPVAGTRAGAVPGVVPEGAGLLAAPEDAGAFADALRTMLTDRGARDRMAGEAKAAGAQFSGWDATAKTVSDVIEALA